MHVVCEVTRVGAFSKVRLIRVSLESDKHLPRASDIARQSRPRAATPKALCELDDVNQLMPVLSGVHNKAYMVSYDVCVLSKTANRTLCYVVCVQLPPSCTFDKRYTGDAVFDLASGRAEKIFS